MSNSQVVKLHHATLKLQSGDPAPVFLPIDRIAFFLASQQGAFTNVQLNTMTDKVMPVIETEQEIISQITGEVSVTAPVSKKVFEQIAGKKPAKKEKK